MNHKKLLLFALLFLGCYITSKAQCPPNLDFELGNTSYWNYYRGHQTSVGTTELWELGSCPPAPTLHTIQGLGSTDYYGGFPTVGDGYFSLKIGKDSANLNADGASYNVHVPPVGAFSLIYRYAIVMENPTGHPSYNMPRFSMDVVDSATNTPVPCNTFSFVSSGGLPGFSLSSINSTLGNGNDVLYKPWTAGSIDLTGKAGATIIVTFKVGGCVQTGHMAYAYVDMNCGLFKISVIACKASHATLTAPPGYQTYYWTDSLTYTASYGATQTVVVLVPSVATTYAVILTPYTGYGCIDTLYARLLPSNLNTHQARDTTICSGMTVKIWGGATDILPLTYSWTPTTGLSCSTCDTTFATPPVGVNLYQITTTDAGGCLQTDTITVTVEAVGGPIKGNKIVCLGYTSLLSDSVTGGVWTTSNSSIAGIGSSTGLVTGNALGTATITYSFGLPCSQVYTTVTVMPLPVAISGTATVCVGLTTTLTDATGGGTWTSSSTVATVGSSTGVVTGIAQGTSTITYTLSSTGCFISRVVTVNPNPAAPTGILVVCQGSTTTLTGVGGGTWSSSNTAVATVGTTGVVTGATSPGTATITYMLSTGCISTVVVTVNLTPAPITGFPSVCVLNTVCLSDVTPGGIWTSANTTVATVGSTGCVTGVVATSTLISYTLASGCQATIVVTVQPIPVTPTGITSMCVGTTTTLFDAMGPGTWSSASTTIAIVGSTSGVVTGQTPGTTTITYTLATGCLTTIPVTVNPNPPAPTGIASVCVGGTSCLTDAIGGGTWTVSNPSLASITLVGGCISGISGGVDTVTYTLGSGCYSTRTITINPAPPVITGLSSVCVGATISLTDASGGGTWSSSNTNALVGSVSGIVTGNAGGTSTITYTLPTGCFITKLITVNAPPTAIIGPSTVCVGASISLSDATSGGTWSVSNTNASVGTFTGVVNGLVFGTSVVTYTIFTTGCFTTATITISPAPGPVLGKLSVCLGSTTGLSDLVAGGSWTSSSTTVAIGSLSGIATGMALGTSTISYSLGGSCKVSAVVTVVALPSPPSGSPVVCVGQTTALTDAGGGTWMSSNTNATVGSSTGIVTGSFAGTSTIIYTLGTTGCSSSVVVTVNPLPTAILGTLSVCVGQSTTLTDATPGGTWSSPSTTVAVGSSSGLVSGSNSGPAIIVYKLTTTGCVITTPFTVNPLPGVITGPSSVCVNSSITLSDGGGGTWASANTTVSVVAGSGLVTGEVAGTASITYTLGTGCVTNKLITVNPLPGPIIGSAALCIGATTSLTDGGGGTWTSSNSTIIAVDLITGSATAGSTLSCATITYTLPTGCLTTTTICVSPSPTPITGPSQVCVGSTIPLSDGIPGGLWTSVLPAIGTIDGLGNFTGKALGVDTIKYSLGSGCTVSKIVTVNALPSAITGAGTICIGQSLTLSDATGGGTWSSTSTAVTVGSLSGLVTGSGAGVAIVTYSVGCIVTTTVTVSPTPAAISGPSTVCQGANMTLSDLVTGGTWTSTLTTVATIGSSSGFVTGMGGGTTIITYSLGGACTVSKTVTVNPIGAITGAASMCVGVTLTVSDLVPTVGSTWTSGTTSVATIDPVSGLVTAKATGTTIIVYLTPAGCTASTTINVSPTPSGIVGPGDVCKGSTIFLSDLVGGGTWTAPAYASVVTVGSTSGSVFGVSPGTAVITYSLGGTCVVNKTVTVDPVQPITGGSNLCTGNSGFLSDAVPGGTWTSSNTSIALVGYTTGLVTALLVPGTSTITYTTPAGCISTVVMNVNSVPSGITGVREVCQGLTTTLSDGTVGGTWFISPAFVAIIGSSSGVVTGNAAGTATVTYSLGSGCQANAVVTVNPLPASIIIPGNLCPGTSITLSDPTPGGSWSASNTNVSFGLGGLVTGMAAGTAVVTYTLPITGCLITKVITVNPAPAPIGGVATVCVGQTTTLTETGVGTWSSTSTTLSVGPTTGVVTGLAAGPGLVTWNASSGCKATITVSVVPKPTTILPLSPSVCANNSITLTSSPGGVWTSSDTAVATVDPLTGSVFGSSSGTVLISYTAGFGCMIFTSVIVNPMSPVTGPTTVCIGQSIALYDTTLGGTWSSTSSKVTVGSGTGIVTGLSGGTALITYSLGTGCKQTYTVTVAPAIPSISGGTQVCVNSTILLTDPGLGTWSSSNTAVATVDPLGNVTGVNAGSVLISYNIGLCAATHLVNVNPLPLPISGNPNVCIGQTTLLTDGGSGTWSSTLPGIGSVGVTSGVVTGITAGTTIIDYTLSTTGCINSTTVNVNSLPSVITGVTSVCIGQVTALTDAGGGTWTSSNTAIAQVDNTFGFVSGIAKGTATITYMLPGTGCAATTVVTVNSVPTFIIGTSEICEGSTYSFSDMTPGGTWSSDYPGYATVGLTSGVVTGISAGITNINYSLGTGCSTSISVLVDPLPAVITGNNVICVGTGTVLTDATGTGGWSSTFGSIATIDAFGNVMGVNPGTTTISYTLATGCASTDVVTVKQHPTAISGTEFVCLGSTYVFSDGVPGGTWTSSNTAHASVGLTSGVVTGLALGGANITYDLAPGCNTSMAVNVVPPPNVYIVTGGGSYCAGGVGVPVGLNGSSVGANYFLYKAGILATGPVAGTGSAISFGLQTTAGAYSVKAVNTGTACEVAMTGTVNVVINPSVTPAIKISTGLGDTVCSGTLVTFTGTGINGGHLATWKWNVNGTYVSLTNVYSYVPANGDIVTATMTSDTLCAIPAIVSKSDTMMVSTPQLPTVAITADPGDTICQGKLVTISAATTYGGSAPKYTWMKNASPAGTGPVFSYAANNGDVVYCNLTSSFPCVVTKTVASNSIVMVVDSPLIPHVTIDAHPGANIGIGWSDTLHAVVSNAGPSGATYQWMLNGTPLKGQTTATYISNKFQNGDSVSVLVTSSGLCEMTSHNWIYMNVSAEAVNQLTQTIGDITVLPNPNKGEFTIKGSLGISYDEEVSLEITDLLGQVVYKNKVVAKNGLINKDITLSKSLANGMYMLSVHSDAVNKVFHVVVEQ